MKKPHILQVPYFICSWVPPDVALEIAQAASFLMSNSADASSATRGGIMFASITACQHHNFYQKIRTFMNASMTRNWRLNLWITLDKSNQNLVRLLAEQGILLSMSKSKSPTCHLAIINVHNAHFLILARIPSQAILICCIQESHLNLVLVSSCDIGDCPACFLLNALFVIVGKKLKEAG